MCIDCRRIQEEVRDKGHELEPGNDMNTICDPVGFFGGGFSRKMPIRKARNVCARGIITGLRIGCLRLRLLPWMMVMVMTIDHISHMSLTFLALAKHAGRYAHISSSVRALSPKLHALDHS